MDSFEIFSVVPAARTRLDVALTEHGISRRAARRLIGERSVLVNSKSVAIASRMVGPGDTILAATQPVIPSILIQGPELIAIDKPSGIPTQPARDRTRVSLMDLVVLHLAQAGESSELYVVHRLDSGTSGVVVFGRTREFTTAFSQALALGMVEKRYIALVHGRLESELALDSPISRESASRFSSDAAGRPASTTVRPLAVSDEYTIIEARILTGRTHQIRLHLAEAGYPVGGDRKYGLPAAAAPMRRLMLHAWWISHPLTGRITAALHGDFLRAAESSGLPHMEEVLPISEL
jgi:23S rRNA pseudouridine1911/1915/1917 synthase